MKQISYGIGLLLCLLSVGMAQGQKVKDKGNATAKGQPEKSIPVTLGGTVSGGKVKKPVFDSLIRHGLRSGEGTVSGFSITYAEHNLFEDSVGNLIRVRDVYTEYCFGDSLSSSLKAILPERTKRGDTAWFDRIKVMLPNGKEVAGKAMQFAIE